jgi:ell wall binding domain 2 (CWB2)
MRLYRAIPRGALLAVVAALGLALGGCGGDTRTPVQVRLKKDTQKETVLGFPALATKNTTRVGGKDPVADAAAVAAAVFPGHARETRPRLVSLVADSDWRAGIAAAALMAPPVRAPVLLGGKDGVPDATAEMLDQLSPSGLAKASGAQVVAIGEIEKPDGLKTTSIAGADPFSVADAIDAFRTKVAGQPSPNVVVAPADQPRYAMPAAAWAAKSGDAVLFTGRDKLPEPTRRAITRHEHPSIYVLGPANVISNGVLDKLAKLGAVKRVGAGTPVDNAIAFARFSDGEFGWGIKDPGHGMVFVNSSRTQDAAAGAALSASGKYGPLLLLDSPDRLPDTLASYLLDIEPGYRFDPVRGVYNHAWLMGDESAISVDLQAKIDQLMEIVKVKQPGGS